MTGGVALGGEVKRADAASYDVVAARFDQLSERFSAPIAERLLDIAGISNNERILDVGVGTGVVALRAAERCRSIVGVDHSAGMLRQAGEKARRLGLGERVAFRKMDAEALEFEAGSFDVAVSLFVFLHLPDPLAAARELYRVLVPGGRVVVGIGAGPPLISGAGLQRAGQRLVGALAEARGRMLSAPAFMRALMSEMGLIDRQVVSTGHATPADAGKILAEAGFACARPAFVAETFTLSAEDFWDVCTIYGSPERVRLAQLSKRQLSDLKDEFMRRAANVVSRNGKLVYHCGARIYVATRPGG